MTESKRQIPSVRVRSVDKKWVNAKGQELHQKINEAQVERLSVERRSREGSNIGRGTSAFFEKRASMQKTPSANVSTTYET